LWYQPNALGQPTRVGLFATNASFHPNGQYKSYTQLNGCVNTMTLYTSGLPNTQRSLCSGTNAVYNQYTFDANGNVALWDDKQSNTYDLRFTYDGLDRLDNIRKADQSLIGDMNYDTMGNITKFDSIAGTINYTYDSAKRLQTTSGMRAYDFSYDARGNVTDSGYHTFSYNLANQMTEADGNDYLYDGHNKRVKTVDGTGTRYSMYSLAGKLVYERINGANRENYYLGSQLVAHQGAGSQTFIHPDLMGTTAAKTNSSGAVTKRLRYAPFGLEWGKTNAESGEDEIGYTGHKHDNDIGLTYMQARYYDPVIGRFYSNDPVGFRDVHSFNRYAYANNNPFKFIDPTGMAPEKTAQKIVEAAVKKGGLPQGALNAARIATSITIQATNGKNDASEVMGTIVKSNLVTGIVAATPVVGELLDYALDNLLVPPDSSDLTNEQLKEGDFDGRIRVKDMDKFLERLKEAEAETETEKEKPLKTETDD
jgi:RHS repeat-associated protein